MKSVVLSAAFALAAAAPLAAQTAPATATAPAASAAPASTARFNLDTPIETIVADPAGNAALEKVVLEEGLPDITTHPMYDSFKGMTLNQLQPMSGDAISPEVLVKFGAALAAVK